MDYAEIRKKLVQSPYEQMLTQCMIARNAADYEDIGTIYKQCQERRLFEFAQEHEVASIVGARLQAMGKSTPQWDAMVDEWKYKLSQRFEVLDALAAELQKAGIPVIALKNAGIARAIYPHPEECPMGDFDILVKKSDFVRAHEIVMKQGFSFGFRAEQTIEEEGVEAGLLSGGCEYKMDLADDVLWLELQWRPIAGRWISPEVEPLADDLIASSLKIDGSELRVMDPVSNLLEVTLHTAKHSYVRAPGLRLHTDVDRIVRAYPDLDWFAFVDRVKSMHVKTPVFFSLLIPRAVLDTPIPDDVIESLKPGKRQFRFIFNSICKAGLFHPMRSKFSRPRYLAFAAALFDSPHDCFKSAFPSAKYMREHYHLSSAQLPMAYIKRFANLLFRRVKT